jgi:hypothetical protein
MSFPKQEATVIQRFRIIVVAEAASVSDPAAWSGDQNRMMGTLPLCTRRDMIALL